MNTHFVTSVPKASKLDYAKWLSPLQPNTIVVGTLCQAVPTAGGALIKGDRYRYEDVAAQLVRRLSKRVYGKAYRRHKLLIPNAVTIEGDGTNLRWHLNILMRKPDWISNAEFAAVFDAEWNRSEWTMANYKIEQVSGDALAYALKDGPEALVVKTVRF